MSSPSHPAAAAAAVASEPCPTPLEWRVVLAEFRRQCRSFATEDATYGGPVTGVTFGSGTPLYILGPATGDRELFALLAWLLKDDVCCVFVDPPRIGWPVCSTAELPRQSGAVVAAAEHLRHDRFAMLGVGFGCATALDVCVNDPDRPTALAMLQASARFAGSWLERGLYRYGSCLPGSIGNIPGWPGVQRQNHRAWFPPFDASRFDFLLENLSQTPTAQFSRRMLLWSDLDFRPQLSTIETPLLLIETEGQGPNISRAMHELQAGVRQARVESLHSAGLHPYLTHPHRVAKLLRSFLEDVRPFAADAPTRTIAASGSVP